MYVAMRQGCCTLERLVNIIKYQHTIWNISNIFNHRHTMEYIKYFIHQQTLKNISNILNHQHTIWNTSNISYIHTHLEIFQIFYTNNGIFQMYQISAQNRIFQIGLFWVSIHIGTFQIYQISTHTGKFAWVPTSSPRFTWWGWCWPSSTWLEGSGQSSGSLSVTKMRRRCLWTRGEEILQPRNVEMIGKEESLVVEIWRKYSRCQDGAIVA